MYNYIDNLHFLTLNTGLARLDNNWNWNRIRSPFARIYYILEGSAKVVIHPEKNKEEKELTLVPGHLYLIPPFTMHSTICKDRFSHYYVHFIDENDSTTNLFEDWDFPSEVPAMPADIYLFEELCEMNPFMKLKDINPDSYDNHTTLISNIVLNKQRPLYDKIASRGILYMLVSRFLRKAEKNDGIKDQRIHKVIKHIRSNITKDLRLEDLAKIACMSKEHLIRKFKETTGTTPLEYAIDYRLERVQLMLVTTDMPVSEIAVTLGYTDSSYLSRLFKKNLGVTPMEYRRKLM